jgi:septal ring factor EnvC (AmiA/AmiB activator)
MVSFRKQTSQRLNQLDDVIATLSTRVQILEDERAATAQTLNDVVERTDSVDARITSTSTELARQLDELGTELSAVADQEPVDVTGIVNGALDEIRRSQTRLANEQARYQSAFRTDIAVLIEQLRK